MNTPITRTESCLLVVRKIVIAAGVVAGICMAVAEIAGGVVS